MNEDQYCQAIKRASALIKQDPDPGTPEATELELLVDSCTQYENEHFKIDPPTPEEAAAFRREQDGRS